MNATHLIGKLFGHSKTPGEGAEMSALGAVRVCTWEYAIATGTMTCAPHLFSSLGLSAQAPSSDEEWRRLLSADSVARLLRARAEVVAGRIGSYEVVCRVEDASAEGARHVLERGAVALRDGQGSPLRLGGVWIDVTARAEEEARSDWAFQAFEESDDLQAIVDLQGRLLHENRALRARCGRPTWVAGPGRPLGDLYDAASSGEVLRTGFGAVLTRGVWRGEAVMQPAEGAPFRASQLLRLHRDAAGLPAFVSLIARDLSEEIAASEARIATERRAAQARRLESLGLLAGGLAHEFNNLLTAVLGNASLARSDLREDPVAQSYFRLIEEVSFRAAEQCQVLHAFAGRGQVRPQTVDLNPLIDEWLLEHRDWLGNRVRVAFTPSRSVCNINLDTHLFSACLRQLLDNAIEASTDPELLVVIRTGTDRAATPGAFSLCLPSDPLEGDVRWIEVMDQGCGMSATTLERACEPFFTTKQGHSGLGLSTVLGVVRSHGGCLLMRSEPGQGTTVRIALPCGGAPTNPPIAAVDSPRLWRGAGQILLVDDQATVRSVATRLLENLGFTPLVAADGSEAVKVFRQHAESLRCVLLDMSMPGMDGETTYREFRRINAEVPVILMSGFAEAEMMESFKGLDLAGYLQKPFTLEQLSTSLKQVLA